jgi:5'-phosphate synthase pdxT subunit
MSSDSEKTLIVGVVALQGAFREHVNHIEQLNRQPCASSMPQLEAILVRTPRELERCQALILPGGESTAIALGAHRAGLLEPLRDWVRDGRPVWGTCAGMILLAREASGIKKGGQELLGGLDIRVGRNGFGSQVDSFEHRLDIPALSKATGDDTTYPGVFIRAPVVEAVLLPKDVAETPAAEATMVGRGVGEKHEAFDIQPQERERSDSVATLKAVRPDLFGRAATDINASSLRLTISVAPPLERAGEARKSRPPLEILATLPRLPRDANPSAGGGNNAPEPGLIGNRPLHDSMIVALKQGRLMCTSFHPELTTDSRLHEYFIRQCVLEQI